MVWGAISENHKFPLVFVPPGVKINRHVYTELILEKSLKPFAKNFFGDDNWTFQQDGATSHTAKSSQEWCKRNCPNFISKDEWPPCSPDLNPLDYSIWSILENAVNASSQTSISNLKKTLLKQWDNLSLEKIRAAIKSFPKRLSKVIGENGGHIE